MVSNIDRRALRGSIHDILAQTKLPLARHRVLNPHKIPILEAQLQRIHVRVRTLDARISRPYRPMDICMRVQELPNELIDMIRVQVSTPSTSEKPPINSRAGRAQHRHLNLLQVNRDVRARYAQAYYNIGTFTTIGLESTVAWLGSLPPAHQVLIRSVSYYVRHEGDRYRGTYPHYVKYLVGMIKGQAIPLLSPPLESSYLYLQLHNLGHTIVNLKYSNRQKYQAAYEGNPIEDIDGVAKEA